MSKKYYFFACAMVLFSSETLAMPASSANFKEGINNFTYTLQAADGVTGNTAADFDIAGTSWTVYVHIKEDSTFNDSLFITGSATHSGGPVLPFTFSLPDSINYDPGVYVLPVNLQLLHPTQNYPLSYDKLVARLVYRVDPGVFDDFSFYQLSLKGTHTDVPEPASLALFSLGLAGLAVCKRFSVSRSSRL